MTRRWVQQYIALFLLAALALCGCTAQAEQMAETPPEVSAAADPEISASETSAPEPTEPDDATPPPATEPPAPTEAVPEPPPAPTEPPAPIDPVLKERPPVDDSFFSDAAFFGNSLVQGLALYGGLRNGDFYGKTSAAVDRVATVKNSALSDGTEVTMLDALGEYQYGKIYVLMGINEISFDVDYFIWLYNAMLDEIAAREPDAEFYIMSLTPVTGEKSSDETLFTQERVLEYNDALRLLAAERGCWYVDLVEALAGEDGYLPEENSTDGIHLTQPTYRVWANYLRTHYAPAANQAGNDKASLGTVTL